MPDPSGAPERRTLRFARFVVRRRAPLALLLALSTLFFLYPILNAVAAAAGAKLPGPVVRVDSKARDLFPRHRFIQAMDKFAGRFGNSTTVALVVAVKDGTIYTPETLAKLDRITRAIDGDGYDSRTDERRALRRELEAQGLAAAEVRDILDTRYPQYPVNHYQIYSLIHDSTRVVQLAPDGSIEGDFLVEELPQTLEEADALRRRVREKAPYLIGRLVSRDETSALITAGFVTDRLDRRQVYDAVFTHLHAIEEGEQDARHDIWVAGEPILVGWILARAWEILLFVLLAIATIFVLLWLYFRRAHGVLIPMLAAGATSIWGIGFTGWAGIPFDPLILVIPMLITARAVSHTVQMAERFFEDYELLYPRFADPGAARHEAAATALAELIVPGTLGVLTDVAGLLVITVTTIPQMRNLGIFGAFWVAAIVITVEILHPILICYLPPPHDPRHYVPRFMAGWTDWLGRAVTHPQGKWVIAGVTLILFTGSTWIALRYSQIGDASPGTPLFWPDHPFNRAAAEIATRFGGADTLIVYADGDRNESSIESRPLRTIERLDRELLRETEAQGSLSIIPLVRSLSQQLHYGDPKHAALPENDGGIRGQVFQLRQNSPPGTLAQFISNDGKAANLTVYYPDHRGETIARAIETSQRFIRENPIGRVVIRLDESHSAPDAPFYDPERVLDLLYYALGPILPLRAHTLHVQVLDGKKYASRPARSVARDGLPPWIEEFRQAAEQRYQKERAAARLGRLFVWPDGLESWSAGDVEHWWESDDMRIRAVAAHTDALLVQDLSAKDPSPVYQPTRSWARGVQLVMAGGVFGFLAAVNDEVERAHLANITLIFIVIFILHSVTYRSATSGGIIFLQITTATLLSLAYMAIRGVGLNINTLPVQAVGVGIGVDYAIYIVDRIRQEVVRTEGDIDAAIRRALSTTGLAVSFTATTVVGGIGFWIFSTLRFQAEMAQLLVLLMLINMLGAVTVVPAFYSILRPRVATSLLR